MKVSYLLLISLLIVGLLFIPAVSAEVLTDEGSNYVTFDLQSMGSVGHAQIDVFKIYMIQDWDGLYFVYAKTYDIYNPSVLMNNPSYNSDVTLKIQNDIVGSGTAHYNALYNSEGDIAGVQVWVDIDEWHPTGYTGTQTVRITPASGTLFNGLELRFDTIASLSPTSPIGFISNEPGNPYLVKGMHIARSDYYWENVIDISDEFVSLTRYLDGTTYVSNLEITSDAGYLADASPNNINLPYIGTGTWNVTNPYGRIYSGILGSDPVTPTPTQPSQPVLRTGTVTMTDNNGTAITGFEVTAVNAYTGQSYTVATDSDVAVMSLPMDQSIRIRNPQTGEYEESPVGYYRFYGQTPGYRMLNEDGIQVSVLPEEYTSYQICDIRVTSESGYLTGNHKFQIRSRADNSILQTGTVSAKSATTGEWYNTTVSGGLATLILPYDTSNSISQYAGDYYVYATSPGYEDSDYGTQIVVMPHTVSEIRDIHLTPIGGIPTAGNVTLRIQAFSETGPGVANAEIFIAGVLGEGSSIWDTYTASSTGYLTVSVPCNSTYDIVASGTGYYDSARRVEVFAEDPALIEIKLYLSGAPTVEPTTQPTGWVTPTVTPTVRPTDVAPDNNPIDNFRIIFLNMGFDDNYTDWLTGLFIICIGVALGYCLVKRVGAMCGAPIGLLTAVGLGLIPIWALVLIIVIVALAYAKFFMGR